MQTCNIWLCKHEMKGRALFTAHLPFIQRLSRVYCVSFGHLGADYQGELIPQLHLSLHLVLIRACDLGFICMLGECLLGRIRWKGFGYTASLRATALQ